MKCFLSCLAVELPVRINRHRVSLGNVFREWGDHNRCSRSEQNKTKHLIVYIFILFYISFR